MNLLFKTRLSALVIVSAFALSGCSGGSMDQTVKSAAQNMDSKSYRSEIKIETQITDGRNTGTSLSKYEMETIFEPSFSTRILTGTYYDDEETPEVLMYVIENENATDAFINYDGEWIKQSVEKELAESDLKQYDAALLAKNYLKYAGDFKREKKMEGGYTAYRGVIKSADIRNAVKEAGSFKSSGIELIPNSYFTKLKDIEVTAYIDSKDRLCGLALDVGEVMQLIFEQAYYDESINDYKDMKYGKMRIETYIYDFDAVSEIKLPKEAENAREYSNETGK